MEVTRRLVLIGIGLLWFSGGCGGQGTEVVSPPNPNENTGSPQKILSDLYEIDLTLPKGWSFKDYGPGVTSPPGSFQDIDSQTVVVAQFNKGVSGFTVFYSILKKGETLTEFVRQRRPAGEIQVIPVPDQADTSAAVFNQKGPGPHGGSVFDIYIAIDNEILWMRTELVGTDQEKSNTLGEFDDIVESIKFIPKGGAS